MKKIIYICLLLFIITLTGCSNEKVTASDTTTNITKNDISTKEIESILYSNLVEKATQDEIAKRFVNADIPEEVVNTVMQWVNDYNGYMGDLFDFTPDFQLMETDVIDYGNYYPKMKKWTKNRDYGDILCRIAAFTLLKDKITVTNCLPEYKWSVSEDDGWLVSDKETFDTYPLIDVSDNEKSTYFTLYNPINVNKDMNINELYNKVTQEWNKIGITFEKSSASIITVWSIYDYTGTTTVNIAHAGILINDSEGLLFFEKTNPLSPYQATKFNTKEQLKNYMLSSMNQGSENDNIPVIFVMENNNLME